MLDDAAGLESEAVDDGAHTAGLVIQPSLVVYECLTYGCEGREVPEYAQAVESRIWSVPFDCWVVVLHS